MPSERMKLRLPLEHRSHAGRPPDRSASPRFPLGFTERHNADSRVRGRRAVMVVLSRADTGASDRRVDAGADFNRGIPSPERRRSRRPARRRRTVSPGTAPKLARHQQLIFIPIPRRPRPSPSRVLQIERTNRTGNLRRHWPALTAESTGDRHRIISRSSAPGTRARSSRGITRSVVIEDGTPLRRRRVESVVWTHRAPRCRYPVVRHGNVPNRLLRTAAGFNGARRYGLKC